MVELANATLHDLFATKEGYLKWREKAKLCFIVAGTGLGKSTLIINDMAKKLGDQSFLYLVNRRRLEDEINNRLDKIDLENVVTETYQGLQKKSDLLEFLNGFDNIVCDEVHYFVADSTFNDTTFYSFENILKSSAFKVFLTATPAAIFPLLSEKPFNDVTESESYFTRRGDNSVPKSEQDFYRICSGKRLETTDFLKSYGIDLMGFFCLLPSMNERIDKIYLYSKDEELEMLLDEVPEETKVLMFMGNIDDSSDKKKLGLVGWYDKLLSKGRTVSVSFSESAKSKNIKDLRPLSKETQMKLLENKAYDTQYLISTTVLDNGIDIIDSAVRYIVCDIDAINTITLEQCIGRKRLEKDEKITLILRNKEHLIKYKKSECERIEKEYDKLVNKPEEYWNFDRHYLNKCSRLEYDNGNLILLPDALKMAYWKHEKSCCCFKPYSVNLVYHLRFHIDKIIDVTEEKEKAELNEIRNKLIVIFENAKDGVLSEEDKETIKLLCSAGQRKKINKFLKDAKLPYRILPEDCEKRIVEYVAGKKITYRAWTFEKI